MISRCSSPIPAMIVCWVSSSVRMRKVGSSWARRVSAMPILSWSPFVLGSMACEMTGSGKVMFSSRMAFFSSHSVSPVRVSPRPTAAAMSPAPIASMSSRWLACMRRMRPMRSLRPLRAL